MRIKYYFNIHIAIIFLFPLIVFAQESPNTNLVIFDSDIVGADIYIEEQYLGKTPLALDSLERGSYNLKFISGQDTVKKFNVEHNGESFREVFGIFDDKITLISFYSNPSNAEIFVNDLLIGRTPLKKCALRIGVHNIKIKENDYFTYEDKIIAKSNHYTVDTKLIAKYGYLNPVNLTSDITFSINNSSPINIENRLVKLYSGQKEIILSSPNYHRDFKDDILIESNQIYSMEFTYGIKTYKPLFQSAFLPGLGQYLDGSTNKGILLMAANALLAGITTYTIINYNSKVDEYKKYSEKYLETDSEFLVIRYRGQMQDAYNKANNIKTVKNISIGVLIASYLYNLFDAFTNHSLGGAFNIYPDPNFNKENKLILKVDL